MVDPKIILIALVIAGGYLGGKAVVHGVDKVAHKTAHGIVHVVTLGKK